MVLVSEEVCRDEEVGITIVEVGAATVGVALISALELACVEEATTAEELFFAHVVRFLCLRVRTVTFRASTGAA